MRPPPPPPQEKRKKWPYNSQYTQSNGYGFPRDRVGGQETCENQSFAIKKAIDWDTGAIRPLNKSLEHFFLVPLIKLIDVIN